MLAVPYFEKALYELAEDDVTPEKVSALADKIELELQGGLAYAASVVIKAGRVDAAASAWIVQTGFYRTGLGRCSPCRTSCRTRRRATTTATCWRK